MPDQTGEICARRATYANRSQAGRSRPSPRGRCQFGAAAEPSPAPSLARATTKLFVAVVASEHRGASRAASAPIVLRRSCSAKRPGPLATTSLIADRGREADRARSHANRQPPCRARQRWPKRIRHSRYHRWPAAAIQARSAHLSRRRASAAHRRSGSGILSRGRGRRRLGQEPRPLE